jgi:subtilisin family serine protease
VVQYPAAYPGVLAVAATGKDGSVAPVSVHGEQIAIAAPGVDMLGTGSGGTYVRGTGTSDATAIVAGAVALVRSRYPDLSAEEVVHRLTATATDKGPKGRDNQYGYGVLNLMAALTADVPPLEATGSPTTAPVVSADTVVARRDDDNAGGLNRVAVVGAVAVGALILAGFLALVTLRRRSRERSR